MWPQVMTVFFEPSDQDSIGWIAVKVACEEEIGQNRFFLQNFWDCFPTIVVIASRECQVNLGLGRVCSFYSPKTDNGMWELLGILCNNRTGAQIKDTSY